MRVISGCAYHAQGKRGSFQGAHVMRREKEGHFRARISCAGKKRVISGAHVMRRENEGHFGARIGVRKQNVARFRRAWRAGAKPGKFLLRMACAGAKSGAFRGTHGMQGAKHSGFRCLHAVQGVR